MAGNPGSAVFLARIEREGRVPELMLPPPLEVLSWVGVGGGGGRVLLGECSILYRLGQSEGYGVWTG